MSLPFVSCLSLTYGRWWHLEEAIESYLRQDYPGCSELVIVNDMADQTLALGGVRGLQVGKSSDHRETVYELWNPTPTKTVRIINLAERMAPNNLKFDFAVQQARGPLCCFWDDDDISLPHRLSYSVRYMTDDCPYWSMPYRFHYDAGATPWITPQGLHGGDMFRRDAYLEVGGSSGETGHNDQVAYKRLAALPGYREAGEAAKCFYLYRWGGITGHHSAYGETVHHCMAQFDRTVRGDRRFRTGKIILRPKYHNDYEAMAAEAVRAWEAAQ